MELPRPGQRPPNKEARTGLPMPLFILMISTTALSGLAKGGLELMKHFRLPTIGRFCSGHCRSGFCHSAGGIGYAYCTDWCKSDADCPSKMACLPASNAERSFCRVRPYLTSGEHCPNSEECLAGLCLTTRYERTFLDQYVASYCVDPCGADGQCPEGTRCQRTEDKWICFPYARLEADAKVVFATNDRLQRAADLDRQRLADGGASGPARR